MNSKYIKSEEDYNMFEWWKRCKIDNFANFTGRARRKEYWYTQLVDFILFSIFIFFGIIFSAIFQEDFIVFLPIMFIIIMIYSFLGIIPSIAATVRRLHDTGRSGTFYFLSFIPLVGPIVLLVFLTDDSEKGVNKWGANPKEINDDTIDEIGSISY